MTNLFGEEQEFRPPDVWAYVKFKLEGNGPSFDGYGWVKREDLYSPDDGSVPCDVDRWEPALDDEDKKF